jgi:flavin-dependent dehydrogenase
MNTGKPITIIGGGLAGLTLGIALRLRSVPTTVWEAGSYPRHRVCGEFVSGRGQATLERLGLLDLLLRAGARWAQTASLLSPGIQPVTHALPHPALCISRHVLDDLLAREFRRLGGELREHQRWANGCSEAGIVRASGHRVEAMVNGWRWFGLKAHAREVSLAADLELHLFENGYVGLCRLPDRINVCGLFRTREPIPDLRHHWREQLCGPRDSTLRDRLDGARFDEDSFRAVAGLCPMPSQVFAHGECVVGDALSMIPPATGNGMSVAFESAEIAAGPLELYSYGRLGWNEARNRIARDCRRRFARRMRAAAWLHRAAFWSAGRRWVVASLNRFPWLWSIAFRATR